MKLIKTIFNILIFLLLLFLIMITTFIKNGKTIISRENISDFISTANILNVDVNTLFNQQESGITLKQKIFDLAIENDIPEEIINDILKSEEINILLGDFFNRTIIYILEGGSKPEISSDVISDIKQIANISLENNLNIMIEKEQLEDYIDNYCNSISLIVPDRNTIIGDAPINFIDKIINFDLFYLYAFIGLLLVIVAISTKKIYIPIKYLGLSMFISGIIFVILGSMEFVISNLIIENLKGMIPFITPLITNVLTVCFKSGVISSFTAITLILVYITLNKIYTKN